MASCGEQTPPINTLTTKNQKGSRHKSKSDIGRLIVLEWQVIRKLLKLAKDAQYDKHRAVYYQNLASHARTLAFLLKLMGPSVEGTQDLAKLLSEMDLKIRKFVRLQIEGGFGKT